LEEIVPEAPQDLDIDDVDIDLDDERKEVLPEPVPSFDFFGQELLPESPEKEDELIEFSKITKESKSVSKEFDDIKNIFDQIDELSSDEEEP
jgi:Asp-tRNA(Asn)/Glu-tRNA(Gln) amidotransferase C subunit